MKVYIFILFVLSLGIFTIFSPDSFYWRGDILWYFLNSESIENSKYLITKNDFWWINQTSLYYFIWSFTAWLSQNFIQVFLYFVLTFFKLVLTFIFFINFWKFNFKNINSNKNYLYSFLATLFFVFNAYILQKYFYWSFSVYQIFIPIIFFIYWYIVGKKISSFKLITWISLLTIFFYTPFLVTNPPYVLLTILLFIFLIISNYKNIMYKRLFTVIAIILLLTLPFLYNYLLILWHSWDLNTPVNDSWFWTHRNSTLINLFIWQWPWAFNDSYFNYFNYFDNILYKTLFLLSIISSLVFLLFKKKYYWIFLIFVLILFLTKWVNEPFWDIYKYLINELPLFFLYRESIKFILLFYFIVSIIIFLWLNNNKNKFFESIFLWILSILLLLNIYPFFTSNYLAWWNKYTDHNKTIFAIPNDLENYNNYYKNNRNLLLPVSPSYLVKYNFWFIWTEDFENRYYGWEIINSPDGYLYNQELKWSVNNLYNDICNINLLKSLWIDQLIYRNYLTMLSDLNDDLNKKIYDDIRKCELFNEKYKDDNITVYELIKTKDNNLTKINDINYNISLNIKDKINYNFLNIYNSDWKIYLKNQQWFFTKPLFEDTHEKIYDYANSWEVSKNEIISYVNENYSKELKKEWYPKQLENWKTDYKYYTLNDDWSIDVELTLYFKPQLYFYIWLAISASTFLLLILWLIIWSVKDRRKNSDKEEDETN